MRRAIVVAASPSARIWATYASRCSRVASDAATSHCAAKCARSRPYASTVRGASRVADRVRNDSTAGSIGFSGFGLGVRTPFHTSCNLSLAGPGVRHRTEDPVLAGRRELAAERFLQEL